MRAALALLALAALLVAGCGGADGQGSSDDARDASSTTETDTSTDSDVESADESDEGEPTAMPEPVPAGEQPPIVIARPAPFEELVGSFVLTGSAQVHEGTLVWAVFDARLKPMVSGTITASCGAPCRGTYRARIPLAKVPIGSWELHVWSPNVADEGPERLHDTMVPVTVAARRTKGAPDPGTLPPGGAPQG